MHSDEIDPHVRSVAVSPNGKSIAVGDDSYVMNALLSAPLIFISGHLTIFKTDADSSTHVDLSGGIAQHPHSNAILRCRFSYDGRCVCT